VYRALTLSGNEITDASRALGVEGDGLLNDSSMGIWGPATNLCTNGGFETNTTGWTKGGTNTLVSNATQAKFGTKSGLATYADNATLADYAATLTNVAHMVQVRLWIPTAYDGGGVELRQLNYTVAASATAANMGLRDQWQQVTLGFTPGADVIGNIQVNNTGAAPTAGRFVYIDGAQIETGSIATPYVETDGATATRPASRVQAQASLLNAAQSWVVMRVRMGRASTPAVAGDLMAFHLGIVGDTYRIRGYYEPTQQLWALQMSAGGGGYAVSAAVFAAGDLLTLGFKWQASGGQISLNGSAWGTSSPANPGLGPTTANLDIGSVSGTLHIDSDVLWFACGTGTLTDADAATIHVYGNNDLGLNAFPGNPTGFWDAKTGVMEVAQ